MKFRAKKDILFQVIIYGLTALFLSFFFYNIFTKGFLHYSLILTNLVVILVLIPLIWAQLSTNYELTDQDLLYQSGPIKGKIEIKRIREIIKNKSLWVGFKPAIARKGLIIKYDKYEEIYISPDSNEEFVNKIKEINPKIKIVCVK